MRDAQAAGHASMDYSFQRVVSQHRRAVLKEWMARWYVGSCCQHKALQNLVFLAGPHFGSRLAHHGRSMLAYVRFGGETGVRLLTSLELGSEFSWESNAKWLDPVNWKDKGVRPYCLIGDRVRRDPFKAKIFPAHFERGSDMVVRVPSGNLNFRRFKVDDSEELKAVADINGVPFAALADYVHSGSEDGILTSIKRRVDPATHLSLRLILRCLGVTDVAQYEQARKELALHTAETRQMEAARICTT